MASQEDTETIVQPKDLPEMIVHRPWTVSTVLFWLMLACYIPGMQLKKKQEILAIPAFDNELVGDFSNKALGAGSLYYMLWCKGCDIAKHPEYVEDRGRALRVLQKVKEREHDCRDITWNTNDDPGALPPSAYISPSKTVGLVAIFTGDGDFIKCSHKLGKYLKDLRGQNSGDIKGAITSPLNLVESSFNGMTEMIMHHQLILIPIMLLLMWNVCGGWWRSLTNIIISSWAAGASNGLLMLIYSIFPDLELGFMSGSVQFVTLAFCTDYSIFFWTRLQKEREDNPSKEMYLTCIVQACRKSSEVIMCSSIVMVAAYCSTSFYPNLNDMGFMAMNLQLACGMALCGIFSMAVVPAWAACFPSLFDNREPNSPNMLQQCLPAMLTKEGGGKVFWRTWAGLVTRGKMMILIPILAYGCMAPFVVCMTKYEGNFDIMELMQFPGLPETEAYEKMNDHFGSGEAIKWVFKLKASEIGPVNKVAMLQLDDTGAASTAEEVAFAQHAMKMSRKAHGNSLGDEIVMQPEFGKQVCQFSEDLLATVKKEHYNMDAAKIDSIWYGKDPFGGEQHGCRSQDQISDGLKKAGTTSDSKFGHWVHKDGDQMLLAFFPGLTSTEPRAVNLYHLLRDVFEEKVNHEFVMNGKRYWFEAEHTAPISYLKESGVRMKRACPWIMGFTAGIAFLGVAVMFKSMFLPLKFCFTIIIPIAAVYGLLVSVYQENWFKFLGCDSLAQDGGVNFILPYLQIGLLFGLAMDYDIFLFARVYEYRQEGYDNVSAVQKSLVETGPVVMTAGTFMCLSFFFMMLNPIMNMSQIGFLYFFGVFIDTYFTCTCIAPCVLCWGEWLNFFPGYIPPVTRKFNPDEGCDEGDEPK